MSKREALLKEYMKDRKNIILLHFNIGAITLASTDLADYRAVVDNEILPALYVAAREVFIEMLKERFDGYNVVDLSDVEEYNHFYDVV